MKALDLRLSGNSLEAVKVALERAYAAAGHKVKLSLAPSDVHDPTEIPTYLAGYKQFTYRADELSPVILIEKDSDKYRTFSSDDTFRRVDVKNGGGSLPVPEVDPSSSLATYKVIERVIGSFVPDQTESNAGPNYRPRFAASRRCRRAVDLDREIDVLTTLLATAGNWASSSQIALTAGQQWNGGSSSNPILDLQNMLESSVQQISGFWLNQQVANAFVRHPSVKDHFRMFNGDAVLGGAINQLGQVGKSNARIDFSVPGIGDFHVAASKVKNEATGGVGFILPSVVLGVTVPDAGIPNDGEEIATTYTFRRKGPSGVGYETREFRVEGRGSLGGTMIVVSMADTAVMTATNAGAILTSVIQ